MTNESIYAEIEEWIGTLPAWQQDACCRLLSKGVLDSQDIEQLSAICMHEAANKECQFQSIPGESILSRNADTSFRLRSISEVRGVNAIKQKDPLSFESDELTVVYGKNGSGKSGYSRILKRISGEESIVILPNIYTDEKTDPQCALTIEVGKTTEVLECDLAKKDFDSRLRLIDVFDDESGARYFAGDAEPLYLPEIFPFLLKLVDACVEVKSSLDGKKGTRLQSFLPKWPDVLFRTEFRSKVESLNWETSFEDFEIEWSDDDEKRLAEVNRFVCSDSPEAKIRLIDIHIAALQRLSESIEKLEPVFSESATGSLNNEVDQYKTLVKSQNAFCVLAEDGTEVSITSREWGLLWSAASSFALSNEAFDKPLSEFTEMDRCPLCLQKLRKDGLSHLAAMNAYVESSISKEIESAKRRIDACLSRYGDCRNLKSQLAIFEELDLDSGNVLSALRDCVESCMIEGEAALRKDLNHFYKPISFKSIWDSIEVMKEGKQKERDYFEKLLDANLVAQAEEQRDYLESKRFLHESKELILKEIKRLKEIHTLDRAIKLTRTNAISNRINKLSDVLIADQYIGRFRKEVEMITDGAVRVELKKRRPSKGRVPYAIEFTGESGSSVSPKEVLSEGEKRAVALAAFLADTMRCDSQAPLIFDDPINSLDEDYELRILSRLVEVSKERQVIIFTHRISVLVGIHEISNKSYSVQQINSWPDGIHKGLLSSCSVAKNPKNILNSLDGQLSELRKLEENGSVEECQRASSYICTQIRIAIEGCIEHILLNQVVMRFRRAVATKGKLDALAKITLDDCELLDSMMTKYSFNEHLAPLDIPTPCRSYGELKTDRQSLLEWVDEFSKRK